MGRLPESTSGKADVQRVRSVADLVLDLFRGRPGVVAAGFQDGERVGFRPREIDAPYISAQKFEKLHLAGKQALGFYLCDEDWTVWCSCVDFDNKEKEPDPEWQEKAEKTQQFLQGLGLDPVIEVSQSGCAAHVWLFFSQRIPAREVRLLWSLVSTKTGITHREVYPRSDSPRGDGLGNLCRYPLWNKSRFICTDHDWETAQDPVDVLSNASKVSIDQVRQIIGDLGGAPQKDGFELQDNGLSERVQRLIAKPGLLQRRWECDKSGLKDPSMSGLAMAIASCLVRSFVPTNEIHDALRIWGLANGVTKVERPEWVEMTTSKAYDLAREPVREESISVVSLHDAAREFAQKLSRGPVPMISAGVREMDEKIGGVEFGEVYVIAARPSMGKSAFALQVMEGASYSGYPSLIVSLEMSKLQLAKRYIKRFSRIKEEDWSSNIDELVREIDSSFEHRAPMYVAENAWNIDAVCHVIEQHVQQTGVRVVAVDYVQLVGGPGRESHERIESACKTMSELTRRNNIILLMLAQINREGERDFQGKPRLPRIADIRGSGFIEQCADVIALLHWNWRAEGGDTPKDDYSIIVPKCRNRPIKGDMLIETKFLGDKQKFGIDACAGMIGSEFITWTSE